MRSFLSEKRYSVGGGVEMMDIVMAGVGGQGVMLASRILGRAAQLEGYKVSITVTRGLAQRGGSVVNFVRFYRDGEVVSPIIPIGKADILVGFEMLESLRRLMYLRKEGIVVLNVREIHPINVKMQRDNYPREKDIISTMSKIARYVYTINAREIARTIGNPRAENIVILGFLTGLRIIPITRDSIVNAIKVLIPGKYMESNLRAFEMGLRKGKEAK